MVLEDKLDNVSNNLEGENRFNKQSVIDYLIFGGITLGAVVGASVLGSLSKPYLDKIVEYVSNYF